jgi:hypothetical protein
MMAFLGQETEPQRRLAGFLSGSVLTSLSLGVINGDPTSTKMSMRV